MKKQYPGHAKRVMFGIWSFLRQFMYTKFIIVTDDDVDIRDWKEVIWALTTRVDPARDTLMVENTPIDYLDFASPGVGPGQQDGHRRHQQVAGRDAARVGPADRDGRRGQGARRRAVGVAPALTDCAEAFGGARRAPRDDRRASLVLARCGARVGEQSESA